jgi:uncharacterized membrane protein
MHQLIQGKVIQKNFVKFFLIIASLFFVPSVAFAADGALSMVPATGVYSAGDFFTVNIRANTDGADINAAEGVLQFSNTDLQVIRVSNAGSIFNLWVTEPEFSNGAGTITFGGGTTKGYKGSSGQIFSVTFKALTSGSHKVRFSSGAMTAADGRGTNIISGLNGGTYTVTAKEAQPVPEIVVPANTPGTPNVSSPTHPDGNTWYPAKNVEFKWSVPNDVVNVRLTADGNPSSIPAVFYDSPISGKTLEDFDEGAWYMHVQFRNENGWGRVAHFPFNIDVSNPTSFEIRQVTEVDPSDPRLAFEFIAEDEVSGVEDYEIQIDGGDVIEWRDDGSHIYRPEILEPGQHTMLVRALDGAGNFLLESITFTVASLQAPVITDYPEVLNSGGILAIRGAAIPNSTVTIYLKPKNEEAQEFDVIADENGAFTFIMDEKPEDGIYTLWAIATDQRGAKSDPSETITFGVQPSGLFKLGNMAISYLSLIIPLVALIVLLLLLLAYGIKKVRSFRAIVMRETTEAEEVLHESFTKLHFEVSKHVEKLERARRTRTLTKAEDAMIKSLNKSLDDAEAVVSKEIRDIKRVK